jgi:transcriptional regulator with XRE-family HTH domain
MEATNLRRIRKAVRMTQLELSQKTGIERARLSFAECGYVFLSGNEEAAIRRAITETAASRAEQMQSALRMALEQDSTLRTT